MSADEILNSDKMKAIDDFLRANYPLDDYNIQVIQVNVRLGSIRYRFLYASPKLKQVEIYLSEADGAANVDKAAYINFGFEAVDAVSTNPDYQKILDIFRASSLAGSKIPFFTESNATVITSYYDDGKSTSSLNYDKATSKSTLTVIATRPYLLVPDGFSMSNLLIPGTPSAPDSLNIAKLTQEALKKYSVILKDANLLFVDKNVNTYNLMFKNANGYLKLDASIDANGVVTIGRLIITGYKDGDFSNCQKFSAAGKCLSCDANL